MAMYFSLELSNIINMAFLFWLIPSFVACTLAIRNWLKTWTV